MYAGILEKKRIEVGGIKIISTSFNSKGCHIMPYS